MKALTTHTIVVALALALCGTPSMAGEVSNLPVSSSDKDITAAAASPSPLYALNRLDTQSLAAQAMTDQELKAVEGGGCVDFTPTYSWAETVMSFNDGWAASGTSYPSPMK
jgi:hypothetical protein